MKITQFEKMEKVFEQVAGRKGFEKYGMRLMRRYSR